MRIHSHPTRLALLSPKRAVSVETAQTPSLSQRVPATQGTTANTAGCALPGSRRPVLPVAPRPTLHFRNGVSEHVLLQTALTPSLSQRVPATQIKNHPATIRGGRKLNGQSKVLPCVFTRSVVSDTPQRLWPGAQWTIAVQGPKRESIWRNVQQAQTAPRRKARRADEATAIAISPRPPERPRALTNIRLSQ